MTDMEAILIGFVVGVLSVVVFPLLLDKVTNSAGKVKLLWKKK